MRARESARRESVRRESAGRVSVRESAGRVSVRRESADNHLRHLWTTSGLAFFQNLRAFPSPRQVRGGEGAEGAEG